MNPLKQNANFKWLMRGGIISALGDQMTMIALPWLVLKLTGDPLALGLVIALMSIPRAVFILVGGALVDRYSPRKVLMLTKYVNAVLLALLTLLVLNISSTPTVPLGDSLSLTVALTPQLALHIIYVLAFGLGLAQAFAMPSGMSILPLAIPAEHLQAANGMMMGLRQVTMLAGPLLAAGVLAVAGDGNGAVSNARGLAIAFGFDCVSYLLSAWTLSKVTLLRQSGADVGVGGGAIASGSGSASGSAGGSVGGIDSGSAGGSVGGIDSGTDGARANAAPTPQAAPESVLRSIGAGLRMVWDDVPMRLCFIYWGTVSLFIGGAMQVALPVLASELHGASTLGIIMGAHGAGTLLGMGVAAKLGKRLRFASFGITILAADAIAGLLLAPMGMVHATWQAALLMATLGLLTGFIQIKVFTWIQQRVPPHMMGRAMSIFMFIFMGLAPLSAAATGWMLTQISLSQLFLGGGIILVLFAASAYLFTPMRSIATTTP
ncbi:MULTISPECIES: MFS transporter [unclassified Duganella]|uniref:MFS transporter n=1 Tax=unclassified Duganella TaxID=2636909 RepID=UPI000891CE47|nr:MULTISPECIES: MFS transporter [unclassified Duganella]SDG37080.1 Major Facilitator Superfamily protein [Duganella sp. OV458]SDJ66508.1 Major Facilitator Superfamily protein [Duganella sp. OV510]